MKVDEHKFCQRADLKLKTYVHKHFNYVPRFTFTCNWKTISRHCLSIQRFYSIEPVQNHPHLHTLIDYWNSLPDANMNLDFPPQPREYSVEKLHYLAWSCRLQLLQELFLNLCQYLVKLP